VQRAGEVMGTSFFHLKYVEKHRDKYPVVRRLVTESPNHELKVTKTNFKAALSLLIKRGIIGVDHTPNKSSCKAYSETK
jgi:hypothetical protein